jgi:hypothetical protein
VRSGGAEENTNVIWETGEDANEEIVLGRINPNETIKIRVKRDLETGAATEREMGQVQEKLTLTFNLR